MQTAQVGKQKAQNGTEHKAYAHNDEKFVIDLFTEAPDAFHDDFVRTTADEYDRARFFPSRGCESR